MFVALLPGILVSVNFSFFIFYYVKSFLDESSTESCFIKHIYILLCHVHM